MSGVSSGQSRRDLFRATLRGAALGIVAVVAGGTVAKRQRLVAEGKCANNGLCQGCGALPRCELPQALDMREMLERGNHGLSE